MCGICGYAFPMTHDMPPSFGRGCVEAMCAALTHRGPDAQGVYCQGGVGLGHRRLSIIDLAEGAQPMHSPDGRFSLVFNGEIYNYKELRPLLEREGVVFRTHSDTEVLLHACIRWGKDALARLEGMFAFALWDAQEQRLWLVRDRLGVKPLYWGRGKDGGVFFASELTPLLRSGHFEPRINAAALQSYLNVGYVLGEAAIMQGIQRLPAGHYLEYHADNIHVRCWWNLAELWRERTAAPLAAAGDKNISPDVIEQFQSLLDVCVGQRLRSDVPLGVFLSGGVDSAAVTASMSRNLPDVFAFTMGFSDARFNEAPQAARIADALHVRQHTGTADMYCADSLLDIVRTLDEPFADTSIIPTTLLCGMAREHITVALSGDGGDELLAGYVTLHADALFPCIRRLPRPVAALLRALADSLPDIRGKVSFTYKLKQFLAAYPLPPQDAHAWWRMLFSGEQVASLLPAPQADTAEAVFAPFRKAWEESHGLSLQDRFLYMDYKTWLVDDILVKADRASMRHSLELRSPFLDHRLVAFCAGLPSHYKRVGGQGKRLLRAATERRVPAAILNGPKRGFNAPVAQWLCGAWRATAEDAFSPASLHACGIVPTLPRQLWQEHLSGRRDHGFRLFALLMYVLWARHYLL